MRMESEFGRRENNEKEWVKEREREREWERRGYRRGEKERVGVKKKERKNVKVILKIFIGVNGKNSLRILQNELNWKQLKVVIVSLKIRNVLNMVLDQRQNKIYWFGE
jgi:hypothetical protein